MQRTSTSTEGTRRMVGLERHYRCSSCGSERHSWARLRACEACGHVLGAAVIRRIALTSR